MPTLPPAPAAQPRNPLHGLTLERIVTDLAAHYGWDELGVRVPVRCFTHDPSVFPSGISKLTPSTAFTTSCLPQG